jgi:hypothetical protein
MQRLLNRRYAAIDFLCGPIQRHSHQAGVAPGMMPDGMAFGGDPAHQFGVFGGGLADQEECRPHALLRQRLQDLYCHRRRWAVIEGQDHLMVFERQGLRKLFQSDLLRGGGIDPKHAGSA